MSADHLLGYVFVHRVGSSSYGLYEYDGEYQVKQSFPGVSTAKYGMIAF